MTAFLTTETPHPLTWNLSFLAKDDLAAAYRLLIEIDRALIGEMKAEVGRLTPLKRACEEALHSGGKIVLVGCGASGRIAAQIEHDWRLCHPEAPEGVCSVLAGGELTLIESVEGAEDDPKLAELELATLSLSEKDVVIGLSASGRAPYIVSALKYAGAKTVKKPWLLTCNATEISHCYETLFLDVGPMALTGSTRMQATTAMTLALMQILFHDVFSLSHFEAAYAAIDWAPSMALTLWEEECFQRNEPVIIEVDSSLVMPVLADLTERAPTFNLPKFPNREDHKAVLVNALVMRDAMTAADAWQRVLGRPPRKMSARMQGFDLSSVNLPWLRSLAPITHVYPIEALGLDRACGNDTVTVLEKQLLLRLILVTHSTLMMGRLGFFEGNLMTYVNPSNQKLIDRSVRYVMHCYQQKTGKALPYDQVKAQLLQMLPDLQPRESIVLKVLRKLDFI